VINIPCTCGHGLVQHFKEKYPSLAQPYNETNECYGRDRTSPNLICECLNYVPDNLGYVEKLAKKKGLI
jgi:hypothetical protein